MIHIYAIILIIVISLAVKWNLSYWSRRGVIGPTPIPFFGNFFLYFIGRKHYGKVYSDIYNKYKNAAYVGIFKFNSPAILLRDLELVKSVLVENFNSFRGNEFQVNEKFDPILSKNMFFCTVDNWKEFRSQMRPMLTDSKLKIVLPILQESGEKLVNYIECGPELNNPDGFEAKHLFELYTIENVASYGFGAEGHAFVDKNSPFIIYAKKVFENSFMNNIRFIMTVFIPYANKFLKISFLNKEVDRWLRNIVRQVISNREKDASTRRPDFMQSIIDSMHKWNKEENVTISHSFTFLADGYETSSTMLAHCLYQLAANPRIQRLAQREIDDAITTDGGKITYEGLQSLHYLDKIFKETLRMHNPAFMLSRVCTSDFTLPPQYPEKEKRVLLTAGTIVITPLAAIHYDPNYYPDPNTFDPDRYNDSEKEKRPKIAWLGFGEGPRNCVGLKLAILQSKVAMANVLANFNVELSAKTIQPPTIAKGTFLLACETGLWVHFKKRNSIPLVSHI